MEKEVSGEIAELLKSFVVASVVKPQDVKDIIAAAENPKGDGDG